MAANSKIQLCDHTFNPWSGCTKISPGCANCYAAVDYSVKVRGVKWGPSGNRIVKAESGWKEPLKWDREANAAGVRRRVFCASLADIFEDWTGTMLDAKGESLYDDGEGGFTESQEGYGNIPHPGQSPIGMNTVRNRLFRLIDATPNLDWMVLTKRPENIAKMTYDVWCKRVPGHVSQNEGDGRRWEFPKNLWLGVSVENQQAADERIPILLRTPAAVRFLSCEPLLGPVVFDNGWSVRGKPWREDGQDINLVIVGGESGPKARPCGVEWIRSIVQQCKEASVACFVKQIGSKPYEMAFDGPAVRSWGEAEAVVNGEFVEINPKDKKGGEITEWPADLRVRQIPTGATA